MVIGPLGWLVSLGSSRHLRCHQRNAARAYRRRASGCGEAGSQERSAFSIERVPELAAMQFEFRTILVVTRAHRITPGLDVHFTRLHPIAVRWNSQTCASCQFDHCKANAASPLEEAKGCIDVAHCLSIVCLNFEKRGHCLSALVHTLAMQ